MSNKQRFTCNFCGKDRDQVDKLIAGPNVYICNECVTLSYQIVCDEIKIHTDQEHDELPSPNEIKEHLDNYIVGHNEAKKMLSVSAYNHYKRLMHPETYIEKSNILLVGPTGTGKTLFAKTLAKKMNVPFVIADATSLTESGYVGDDVDILLERLLHEADYDVQLAQKGIIYIDEIDKKSKKNSDNSSAKDVSGEGVQQALLRLVEGTQTKVKISGKKYAEEYVDFDTSNVLFIVGGAFVGIERIIQNRLNSSSKIGFNAAVKTSAEIEDSLKLVNTEDFVQYGIIPELMGRLPIIGVLDKLNETHMRSILTDVKDNIIQQNKSLLEIDGIELEFSEDYLQSVAQLALKENLGARALRGIIDNSLIDIMYRVKDLRETGVEKIVFNKYPSNGEYPELIFDSGEKQKDIDYTLYRGTNVEI